MAVTRPEDLVNIIDRINAERNKELVDFYRRAEKELITELARANRLGLNEGNRRQVLSKIRAVIADLEGAALEWVQVSLPEAYLEGVEHAELTINGRKSTDPLPAVHQENIRFIMDEHFLRFAEGINTIERSSTGALNEIQKKQLRDEIVVGEIKGESVPKISNRMRNYLTEEGIVMLRDKGGRRWTVERYTEMLTRTSIMQAANDAAIFRGSQLGVYFYEISSHTGSCDICKPFEGKIYDIRTQEENFPIYHPNCRHVAQPRPDITDKSQI